MVAPQSERGWWLYSPERCDSNAMLSALAMLREHGDTTLASASRNLPLEGATPEEKQRIEAAVGTLMRAAKLDR
jgi:hypothetical protein